MSTVSSFAFSTQVGLNAWMVNILKRIALLALPISVPCACVGTGADQWEPPANVTAGELSACGVDQTEYERLMALSYKKFDQDFFGGWRKIDYREGCSSVAASIISEYIVSEREEPLNQSQLRMLNWHAGQTTAYVDELAALHFFKQTYEASDEEMASDWNLYVRGTIAFINRDKKSLIAAYDELSLREVSLKEQNRRMQFLKNNPKIRMPDGYVTEPTNLPALRGLLACFQDSYRVAYRDCPKRERKRPL